MIAPDIITRLVDHFDSNRDQLVSPSYNETQIRREFIDPFFKALGWDIDNRQGAAEAYKDVVHEDAIKIGFATKAPDYSFRIGGTRKFFVEAKKPAINVKDDVAPAFQLRRYAWSAKLPLSILTDFDELAVYDCRIKPYKADKPTTARIKYLTYKDYIPHWEEIHSIFSRDAVWKGSFDQYVVGTKGKKGTDEVDDAFLKEIESWRDVLARNIALRNSKLSVQELNFAVQRTIDRIIFLRICEDRGIETYGALQALVTGERTYRRLCELFQRADEKYNSGLFHFSPEKGRPETPDVLTLALHIDDKVLKDILAGLYYPDCPYEFSILPADILGQVYEQFLGKVIRLTAGHQAKVEEKPEVKKAGGVYYTPTYIVDYIVKNTVGKLVEGKTPKQVAKLRILDPACGSGSFLIGAYQYLLDWHRDWYTKDSTDKWSTGKNTALYAGPSGVWRLTTAERKRILLNNIHGVDIDSQAVEVTKLSLLLKVLEGENEETIYQQLKMFHERALPDLGNNVKCGNSLVEPDFRGLNQMSLLDEEAGTHVNAFSWYDEYRDAFTHGGFQIILGNPPYGAKFGESEKDYLFKKYPLIVGQPESYEYFLWRSLDLLAPGGIGSFIVPTNFIESQRAANLRSRFLHETCINVISSFRYNVWADNAAETLVIVYQKGVTSGKTKLVQPDSRETFLLEVDNRSINQVEWMDNPGMRFLIRSESSIIRKIEDNSIRLGEIADISQGIIVYKTREDSAQDRYTSDVPRGSAWKRLLDTNSTIGRYSLEWGGRFLHYGRWLWRAREERFFSEPKLLFVRLRNKSLSRKLIGYFDDEGYYNRDNFNNIVSKNPLYNLKYILALFNSGTLNYWYKAYFDNVNINPDQVRLLPIKRVESGNPERERTFDQLISLATMMQNLNCSWQRAKTDQEKIATQRQIDATDKQIDTLVYELYGLTEDDVGIVEGKVSDKGPQVNQ
jgi:type I restriction-modification system DNA methylase subunit